MSYVVTTLNSIVNSGASKKSGLLNALTACPLPEPTNALLAVLTFLITFANSQLLFCLSKLQTSQSYLLDGAVIV